MYYDLVTSYTIQTNVISIIEKLNDSISLYTIVQNIDKTIDP